jgi:hypothetical protein
VNHIPMIQGSLQSRNFVKSNEFLGSIKDLDSLEQLSKYGSFRKGSGPIKCLDNQCVRNSKRT